MAQRNGKPIGKCAVRLDLATGKVWLQSHEALGSTKAERSRLLVDHLLQSMNSKLRARVAHVVHGKDPHDRPSYYKLVKFAVQKEAEINFDEAKKMRGSNSKPKATTHFHYECRKSTSCIGYVTLLGHGKIYHPLAGLASEALAESPPV